jgi:hypothetical protein
MPPVLLLTGSLLSGACCRATNAACFRFDCRLATGLLCAQMQRCARIRTPYMWRPICAMHACCVRCHASSPSHTRQRAPAALPTPLGADTVVCCVLHRMFAAPTSCLQAVLPSVWRTCLCGDTTTASLFCCRAVVCREAPRVEPTGACCASIATSFHRSCSGLCGTRVDAADGQRGRPSRSASCACSPPLVRPSARKSILGACCSPTVCRISAQLPCMESTPCLHFTYKVATDSRLWLAGDLGEKSAPRFEASGV